MGEWEELLKAVQRDKEEFGRVIDKMNPVIKKYTRLLYKDEKEDVRAELILALWQAILKMEYIQNDGGCTVYLSNAVRNRFLELYRKSRKEHDCQSVKAEENLEELASGEEEKINQIMLYEDLECILQKQKGIKKKICYSILFEEMSDAEIAGKYQISRQYTNRVRKRIYLSIKEDLFYMKGKR